MKEVEGGMETVDWTPGIRDALSRAFAHHHDVLRISMGMAPTISGNAEKGIVLGWEVSGRRLVIIFSPEGYLFDTFCIAGPDVWKHGAWPPVQWQDMILYWLVYGDVSEAETRETSSAAAFMKSNYQKMLEDFAKK